MDDLLDNLKKNNLIKTFIFNISFNQTELIKTLFFSFPTLLRNQRERERVFCSNI